MNRKKLTEAAAPEKFTAYIAGLPHPHHHNDGQLHCHSLPNYQSPSAVDMVKRLIDNFPDDFKPSRRARKRAVGHRKSTAHPRLNRGGR